MSLAYPPFKWSNYEWEHGERWGQIHPNNTRQWFDPTSVVVNRKDKSLSLLTRYKPKFFEDLKVMSPMSVGLVNCTSRFGYGTFEIEAKLPIGKRLWPAFWMWSYDGWPPEIDVFEAYTNKKGNYLHYDWTTPFSWWNVKTNVHYRFDNTAHYSTGGKAGFIGFKNPAKNYIKYSCKWTPNEISFYYDGYCVRSITDQVILDTYKNTKMNVVLNNAVNHDAILDGSHVPSDFNIRYFKYTPYRG